MATITKYNLGTIVPANLKSLACVVMDVIMSKIYPRLSVLKFAKKLQ